MPYVNLPPGCSGMSFQDGSHTPPSRPGGRVHVTEAQAAMINTMSGNGEAGLVNGQPGEFFRARSAGRKCAACNKRWMPWVEICHSCSGPTEPE